MIRYLSVEARRLFRAPTARAAALLTLFAPLAGYQFFTLSFGDTAASLYLANPVLCGALAGAVLFALLTLLELDRVRRARVDVLADAAASPRVMNAARLAAIWALALATACAACVLYLPYTLYKLGPVFSAATYFGSWFLLYLPPLLTGSLAAAACYQLVGRVDVGFVAVLAGILLTRGEQFRQEPLMQWSAPYVPALSDTFSNASVFRITLYVRLIWFALLGGVWLLSLLAVRRWGKGPLASFAGGTKRHPLAPALSLALLAGGVLLYQNQPLFDHSPIDYMEAMNSQGYEAPEGVLLHETKIEPDLSSRLLGTMSGRAVYRLTNESGKEAQLFFETNPGYAIQSATANGQPLAVTDYHDDLIASRALSCMLPADREIELVLEYGGFPQIWNTMKYSFSGAIVAPGYIQLTTHNLAPTLVAARADDVSVEVRCTLPRNLTPVTTGLDPVLLQTHENGARDWLLADDRSPTLQLYAADFAERDLLDGASPIRFYYGRQHETQLKQGGAIDTMEAAVRYCTEHYGPRSFVEARPFRIVQDTAFAFGGGAHSDFSTMGEGYFTDRNLDDPDKGASSAEVLAHEIIHQWWGLKAQLMDPADPYWSDEGITTYATYRLAKELYGEEYAQKNYIDAWHASVEDMDLNFYHRNPAYLGLLPEKYLASLNSGEWGTRTYPMGALQFYRAERILGEEQLDAVLSQLYLNGGTEMPPLITRGDFLAASGLTLEDLEHD